MDVFVDFGHKLLASHAGYGVKKKKGQKKREFEERERKKKARISGTVQEGEKEPLWNERRRD